MNIFNQKPQNTEHLPEAYKECSQLLRATYGNDTYLPVLMGVSKNNSDKVFFSLGHENPVVMTKEESKYLVNALISLYKELFNEDLGPKEFHHTGVNIFNGFDTPEDKNVQASKELAQLIDGKEKDIKEVFQKLKAVVKEMTGQELSDEKIEELSKQKEDLENIFENLSPEEKELLEKQIIEEKRRETEEHFESLEKELLGEIKIEELPEFTFEYFDKIYTDKGIAFLKEELAKLPKTDRQSMIEKFMDKYGTL